MSDEKVSKGWRIAAIILGIIVAGFIIISIIGINAINKETECSVNICENNQYDSFYYDSNENICYCYTNGEVAYKEFIGG